MYIFNGTPHYSVLLQNKENILFKISISAYFLWDQWVLFIGYSLYGSNSNTILNVFYPYFKSL